MNTMKKLLFFAAASVMTVSTALAGGDLSKTQARIYINPGHGSWGPNDRNLATTLQATPPASMNRTPTFGKPLRWVLRSKNGACPRLTLNIRA